MIPEVRDIVKILWKREEINFSILLPATFFLSLLLFTFQSEWGIGLKGNDMNYPHQQWFRTTEQKRNLLRLRHVQSIII